MSKQYIDLFKAGKLKPIRKFKLWSFLLVCTTCMSCFFVFSQYYTVQHHLTERNKKITRLLEEKERLNTQKSEQEKLLQQQVTDDRVVALLQRSRVEKSEYALLLKQIKNYATNSDISISKIMLDISSISRTNLWIERITLLDGLLTLMGATLPQHENQIAIWLENFKNQESLKNRGFSELSLKREEFDLDDDEIETYIYFSLKHYLEDQEIEYAPLTLNSTEEAPIEAGEKSLGSHPNKTIKYELNESNSVNMDEFIENDKSK